MSELLKVLICSGVDDDEDDDATTATAANDDVDAVTEQQEVVVVVQQESEEQVIEAQEAVVSVVEAASQEVLNQVHFTMEVDGTTQEQQVRNDFPHTDTLHHAHLPRDTFASNYPNLLFLLLLLASSW